MLHVTKYIKPLEGWSKPHLILCDDGHLYVVKLMSNPQGLRVLANELFCCQLAKQMKLPVPDGEIIYINEVILNLLPLEIEANEGPHFGSRYIPDSTDHPNEAEIAQCSNIDQVADMIIFDFWSNNNDRHLWREHCQNILVTRGKEPKFWMIDNANVFCGPNWTIDKVRASVLQSQPFWGELYAKFASHLNGPDPFNNALSRISALSTNDIWSATKGIPAEWGVAEAEFNEIVLYLDYRKNQICEWIRSLYSEFPNWEIYNEGVRR